jgi:hypothetical protein
MYDLPRHFNFSPRLRGDGVLLLLLPSFSKDKSEMNIDRPIDRIDGVVQKRKA